MFHLFFDVAEELTFIDENGFCAGDGLRIGLNCVLDGVGENTWNHLFVVRGKHRFGRITIVRGVVDDRDGNIAEHTLIVYV